MKERGKLLTNTVVTTVMSNFGLYKALDEKGIGYAKTAVGDKYVYEYMAKNGCRIGGEQSGHIIFSKYASTGDGILTSLKMMEVMLAKKKPMSELAAQLEIYPQVLENVRVTDKKAAQNDPAVQEAVSKVVEALGDMGRILVRESGTEPVVRVMVPLRRSCGECPFSTIKRCGDFTVDDYWGVQDVLPEFDDNKGVSLLFFNNDRALERFDSFKEMLKYQEISVTDAVRQPNLKGHSVIPKNVNAFWRDFQKKEIEYCISFYSPAGIPFRIKRKIKYIYSKVIRK